MTTLFRFSEDGLVSSIHFAARAGLIAGKTTMMPWEGRFDDYRRQDGMMIPFHGEVAWITAEGHKSYFRGSVKQVTYGFAK